MSLVNTAFRGLAWTTFSTIIRSVVTLLRVAILTRFITKGDFGVVAIASLFIDFSQIFLDMGLSSGILHKQNITPNQYSSLFWLNIISGIVITFVLAVSTPFVASYYNEDVLTPVLTLLSMNILFSSFGSQHRIVQQKKMNFKYISIVEIIGSLSSLLVAVVLAIMGYGIYSLVFSTLFHTFLTNILFLIIGLKNDKNISFHFKFSETYPFLKIGIFSVGTRILDFFSSEIDTIIISAFLGKEILGVYTLCKKLAKCIYGIINPILTKILTPLIALVQSDVEKVRRSYYSVVEAVSLVNYPIYLLVVVFSAGILNTLYGETYLDSANILGLLALYYGYLSTGNPVGSLQVALGRTDRGFYWTICRILINLITVYICAQFDIYIIIIGLIVTTVFSEPLVWKITIEPLIFGDFKSYFKNIFLPFIYSVIPAVPLYYFFSTSTNIFVMSIVSLLYLFIYLISLIFLYRESFVISLLKSKIHLK